MPASTPDAPSAAPRLHIESIAARMTPAIRQRFDVRVVESTASTNADLLSAAASLPSGTVLATEFQSAGRGRRGRGWVAPRGGSLAFSVLWKFPIPAARLSGLSLAVGVAVARALSACGAQGVGLKWPNDLLAQAVAGRDVGRSSAAATGQPPGRETPWAKLGGILIELTHAAPLADVAPVAGAPPGVAVVIGIGVNVALGEAARSIDQAVVDLHTIGCTASRSDLLGAILQELGTALPQFALEGFAPFARHWNALHAWQCLPVLTSGGGNRHDGNSVDDTAGDAVVAGIARGVADDGALLIESATGLQRIISGDISLRLAAPDPL